MQKQIGIFRLTGVVQNYTWGGNFFISSLIKSDNLDKRPVAEYWLGAHHSAPSVVTKNNKRIELDKLISTDNEYYLGKTVAKKFGQLPFLLKVLDVKDMLSIQVHPSKHEAEIEFAKENAEGIPINAAHRNYKDDNHKPELMVALSDFWALQGFKEDEKLQNILESIFEFNPLLKIYNSSGYDQLYKTIMEMPQESVNQLLMPLLNHILPEYKNGKLKKSSEDFWAAKAALTFNDEKKIDRGIFSIYFFNLLHLKNGEGVFQDAGVPHAYLEGQNVEIMANSDNVLRGGLTNKHVDVKELMKHIKFEGTIPEIIRPQKINTAEKIYRTPAPDFKLTRFDLKEKETSKFESSTAEILLLMKGKILLTSEYDRFEISEGEAVFVVPHQHILIKALSDADLFRAAVPVHNSA
jgi:mannose-6-phosphate isomerase